ncbi:hypothetical protein PSPO01_16417 [Paraphaeosphaeria sporulosa]
MLMLLLTARAIGRDYHAAIGELGIDPRHLKTSIVDDLWESIGPGGTVEDKKRFFRRLAQATRWYQVAETLGWVSFCLLPDSVSNKWVKNCPAYGSSLWGNR